MFVSGASLLAVLVVGRSAGGASRWLGTGSFQFQPSELAKLALILFAADVLARREGKRDWGLPGRPGHHRSGDFRPPDHEAAGHGHRRRPVLRRGGRTFRSRYAASCPCSGSVRSAALGGYVLAVSASYRAARLTSFLNPFAHASTTGYQSVQGLIALGGGHWAGTGLGQSLASWGYLPNRTRTSYLRLSARRPGLSAACSSWACLRPSGSWARRWPGAPRPRSRASWPRA